MDCTIRVAKTKALISFVVTTKLICAFVFAYAKRRFSHDEAQLFPNALESITTRLKTTVTFLPRQTCFNKLDIKKDYNKTQH